jgi:hypothetical protein
MKRNSSEVYFLMPDHDDPVQHRRAGHRKYYQGRLSPIPMDIRIRLGSCVYDFPRWLNRLLRLGIADGLAEIGAAS